MIEKVRAKYNRTLLIQPNEIEVLKKNIITLKDNIPYDEVINKIINQDLFNALEYLPGNFVDLMIIDPPYNLHKIFNGSKFKEMDELSYELWIDSWLCNLVRLLKPNASVYLCCDWKSSNAIYNIAKKYFKIQNRITWEREKGRGAKKNWKNCSEDIWFCTLNDEYIFNVDDVKIKRKVLAPYRNNDGDPKDWLEDNDKKYRITFPSNFWNDITVPFWSMPENTDHPTQKPEKLYAKLILASSNKGDVIFDPFAGSGTAASTAIKLERNFVCIELDEHYCNLASKRIELAKKEKNIQGFDGTHFWERNTLSEMNKSK